MREVIQGPPEGKNWQLAPDGTKYEVLIDRMYVKEIPTLVNGLGMVIQTEELPMYPIKTTRRWVRTWVEVHDEIWIDHD